MATVKLFRDPLYILLTHEERQALLMAADLLEERGFSEAQTIRALIEYQQCLSPRSGVITRRGGLSFDLYRYTIELEIDYYPPSETSENLILTAEPSNYAYDEPNDSGASDLSLLPPPPLPPKRLFRD